VGQSAISLVKNDVIQQLTDIAGPKRHLTALVRPAARWWILRMSSFYRA
jgi:hypothetical protein